MLDKPTILSRIEAVPGWMSLPAAQLSLWLLEKIERDQIPGNLLEIGVFKGKFLSLMRAAAEGKILGINICEPEWAASAVKEILSNVETAAGTREGVEILIADSTTLTTDDLRNKIGPIKFAHIDGGHDARTVFHDLTTTAPLLQPGGILVMDDAFNFSLPGVIEGVCKFFDLQKGRIAPFSHCYNKLFATTPDFHQRYLDSSREFLNSIVDADIAAKTKQRIAENAAVNFKTEFSGFETLIFL